MELMFKDGTKVFTPGSPKRQDFRKKVLDRSGVIGQQTPPLLREYVVAKYFPYRDVIGAALEIQRQYQGLSGHTAA